MLLQTAKVILDRANHQKENMGLTHWKARLTGKSTI